MITEQKEQQMRLLEIENQALDLSTSDKRRLIEALLGSANDKAEFAQMTKSLLTVLDYLIENGMPEYERSRYFARCLSHELNGE